VTRYSRHPAKPAPAKKAGRRQFRHIQNNTTREIITRSGGQQFLQGLQEIHRIFTRD